MPFRFICTAIVVKCQRQANKGAALSGTPLYFARIIKNISHLVRTFIRAQEREKLPADEKAALNPNRSLEPFSFCVLLSTLPILLLKA